jgi:hypothetical protein
MDTLGGYQAGMIITLGGKETVMAWLLDMPTLQHLLRQLQGRVALAESPASDHVVNRSIYNTWSSPGPRRAAGEGLLVPGWHGPISLAWFDAVPREQVPEVRERQAGDRPDVGV